VRYVLGDIPHGFLIGRKLKHNQSPSILFCFEANP